MPRKITHTLSWPAEDLAVVNAERHTFVFPISVRLYMKVNCNDDHYTIMPYTKVILG